MTHWGLRKRRIGLIGLDIGHAYIRMVQLASDRRGLHVLAAQRCPTPQDRSQATFATAIRRLWEAGRFRGREVVVSLPNEGMRVTSVRMSEADLDQTPDLLYAGLAQRFALDLERETVRHIPAGPVHHAEQTRHEVILLAANNEEIDERIHLLLGGGLVPVGLDPVACALFRCYDRTMQRQEDQTQSLLYIDIGAAYTTVAFGRDHQLCFIKQLSLGADRIGAHVARVLGVDTREADTLRQRVQQWVLSCEASGQGGLERLYEPEAGQPVGLDRSTQHLIRDAVASALQDLSREIGLCMRYYAVTFRGHRTERIWLSGAVAQDRILQRSLAQQLGVEIMTAAPFDMLHGDSDDWSGTARDPASQWAVAVGLALKEMEPSDRPVRENSLRSLVPALAGVES